MPVGVVGSDRTSRPIPEALSFMMVSFSGVMFVLDVKVSVILISKNDNVEDNNARNPLAPLFMLCTLSFNLKSYTLK
jgi:hypothetical protein